MITVQRTVSNTLPCKILGGSFLFVGFNSNFYVKFKSNKDFELTSLSKKTKYKGIGLSAGPTRMTRLCFNLRNSSWIGALLRKY